MESAKKIAELLLAVGAVKVRLDPPFTWTSGIKSPVYCDNRKVISYPKERRIIVDGLKRLLKEHRLSPDCIGGTATAAISWAAFLAAELDLPMVYIRPEPKWHGAGKQVEGDLSGMKHVLIVEDLISTGGSSIGSAEAVKRESDATVTDVIAIMTWELQEAKEKFQEAGLNLFALTNFTALATLALEKDLITQEQWDKVLEFKRDPRAWAV